MKLKINEIYKSIQGESTYSGRLCTFIRLTYCNLRCSYCDTEYAFYEGNDMEIEDIISKVNSLNCNLIEVTGGEPLAQDGCIELLEKLILNKNEIMLETGGGVTIKNVPKNVRIILDIKCPSSNMSDKNIWENINFLTKNVKKIIDFKCPSSKMEHKNLWKILEDVSSNDEIKFVIGDKDDYQWSKNILKKYKLISKYTVLFSPVHEVLEIKKLTDWILNDNLKVRLQVQLHKYIWGKDKTGV